MSHKLSLKKQYAFNEELDTWRLKDTFFTETKSDSDTYVLLKALRNENTITLSHDGFKSLPASLKEHFINPLREAILEKRLNDL